MVFSRNCDRLLVIAISQCDTILLVLPQQEQAQLHLIYVRLLFGVFLNATLFGQGKDNQ